jgi:quinol-cytochrome oxidoreductase complex cytochrome b subunit
MLDLKSFHIVLIAAAIVLMTGLGVWGLLNAHELLGIISLAIGVLLIPYGAYFAARFERT